MKKYAVSTESHEFRHTTGKNIYTTEMANADLDAETCQNPHTDYFEDLETAKAFFNSECKSAHITFRHENKLVLVDTVELDEVEEDEDGDIDFISILDYYVETQNEFKIGFELVDSVVAFTTKTGCDVASVDLKDYVRPDYYEDEDEALEDLRQDIVSELDNSLYRRNISDEQSEEIADEVIAEYEDAFKALWN